MTTPPSTLIPPPPAGLHESALLPQIIDSTMLTCFASCPRKFYWEFILGFRPGAGGLSIDLHAGACFAKALENVYEEFWTRGTALDLALARAHYKYMVQWGDFPSPTTGPKSGKSKDNVWLAVEEYFKLWPPKTDHIQPYFDSEGKPSFEFTFAIPLDPGDGWPLHPSGEPFLYSGRLDALGTYRGRMIGRDEKSTTGIGSTWSERWDLRAQFLGYVWALQQQGLPINTISVRGIGLLKTEIKLIECLKIYQPFMVERWLEQTKRRLHAVVRLWNEGYFDFNFGDACTSYGGCNFTLLCKSPEPETWFSNYTVNRWDPLALNPVEDSTT